MQSSRVVACALCVQQPGAAWTAPGVSKADMLSELRTLSGYGNVGLSSKIEFVSMARLLRSFLESKDGGLEFDDALGRSRLSA